MGSVAKSGRWFAVEGKSSKRLQYFGVLEMVGSYSGDISPASDAYNDVMQEDSACADADNDVMQEEESQFAPALPDWEEP